MQNDVELELYSEEVFRMARNLAEDGNEYSEVICSCISKVRKSS
jgi:hypothetical protein